MTINQIMASSSLTKLSPTPADAQRTQTPVKMNETNTPLINTSTLPQKIAAESFSDEQIAQAVEQINDELGNMAQDLKISIDKETGKTIVKIIDTASQEVIRQFPTEEAVAIARSLDKVHGLLFEDKA